MLFITGPLYSGKRTFAVQFGGRQIYEVQDRAAEMAGLQALADELAAYDVVTATEVGGGIADCVVQMFCGLPTILKGELPKC